MTNCRVVLTVGIEQRDMIDWFETVFPYGKVRFGNIYSASASIRGTKVNIINKNVHWNIYRENYNYTSDGSTTTTCTLPLRTYSSSRYSMTSNPNIICFVGPVLDNKQNSIAYVLEGHQSAIGDYIRRVWRNRDARMFRSHNGFDYLIETSYANENGSNVYPPGSGSIFPLLGRSPIDKGYATTEYTISIIESTCFLPQLQSPPSLSQPSRIYDGAGSPPPKREKMSNCCDCNTIATIVENQAIAQLREQEKLVENLKDHIDQRALEIIIKDREHLKALDFEQFLKAILQRINESEANLWNGVSR